MNRVLTIDEVLALHDGCEVWVELRRKTEYSTDGVFTARKHETSGLRLLGKYVFFTPELTPEAYGRGYRAWELPRGPTTDELESYTWI